MAIEAEALRAPEETEMERDALAVMLADCVAVMEQIPLTLLPGRIDMMLMSALDAPMHNVAATRAELITRAKAIRSALAEDTARAVEEMRERAAKVCDDRAALCGRAAQQWLKGSDQFPSQPDIATSMATGADQCRQAAVAIRALPLTKEAADANR